MKPAYRAERARGRAQYDLPPTMCREIGRIIVRWAYLESTVQSLIRRVLQITEPQARIALREPRLSDRLIILRDLVALIDGEWDDSLFKSILKRSTDLKTYRDMVAHNIWAYRNKNWYVERNRGSWEPEKASLVEAKSRVILPELVSMNLDHLKEIRQQIDALIDDIRRLRDEANGPKLEKSLG